MRSIDQSCAQRWRRALWRFPQQLSGKRVVLLLLVAGVACSAGFRARLPFAGQLLLWTLLLLAVAWLLRGQRQSFFGPIFFYDLVRSSRRGEQVGHRFFYALVLVCVLAGVYWSWFPVQSLEQLMHSRSMSISERARFAGFFFASFMGAQLVVVVLITPLYTANAIAEQKERRTLDFLLLTDLTDREIILGTLGARLAKLLLLVLTGLPILSLLEFLGGVEPGLVLAAFVATCMLMASLGSLSILASVYARTASGAVAVSYLVCLVVCGLSVLITGLYAAHSVVVVGNARSAWSSTPLLARFIMGVMVFSFIHGLVVIFCCRNAIAQVRRVALEQAGGTGHTLEAATSQAASVGRYPARGVETGMREDGWGPSEAACSADSSFPRWPNPDSGSRPARPPVGTNALLWKEIYEESGFGLAALRQLGPRATLATRGLGLVIFLVACLNAPEVHGSVSDYLQDWVRRLGIVLNSILLLMVALSASYRVSRERERRTLDNLLTLPVRINDILFTKWLGSILSVSRLGWLLGLIWALGIVTGALNVFALPLLVAATVVYAGFIASLGLWFSTVSGSTLRSSLFTLLAALLFLTVPGALATTGNTSLNLTPQEPFGSWWSLLLEYGLSPPATLGALSFRSADLLRGRDVLSTVAHILAAVAGLHCYLAATAALWMVTRARFRTVGS